MSSFGVLGYREPPRLETRAAASWAAPRKQARFIAPPRTPGSVARVAALEGKFEIIRRVQVSEGSGFFLLLLLLLLKTQRRGGRE